MGWGHARQRVLLIGDSNGSSAEEEQAAPSLPPLSVRAGTRLFLGPVQPWPGPALWFGPCWPGRVHQIYMTEAAVDAMSNQLDAAKKILWRLPAMGERPLVE